MTINMRAVQAILKAEAVLANEKDPLRAERAELMLTKNFSEGQSKRITIAIAKEIGKPVAVPTA